jgi:hypothetical protein
MRQDYFFCCPLYLSIYLITNALRRPPTTITAFTSAAGYDPAKDPNRVL